MAGNNNYGYPFYNNNNIPIMQAQNMMQASVQCFAVNSREEANRIPIQIGIMYVIINKAQKEIYIKQYNNDGLIDMDIYKDEKLIQPAKEEKDYEGMIKGLSEQIETLTQSLKPKEANNV
jgi:hypothetical protein